MLDCPLGCTSLLRTVYRDIALPLDETRSALGRFHRRLPGDASRLQLPLPPLLELPWLRRRTGLARLHVLFSGWWPQRGALLPSGSFKDLEAAAVLARLDLRPQSCVVLASAGNTAAAFATACTQLARPCVIVIAEEALARIRLPIALGGSVRIVAITENARYDDAIALSRALVDGDRFVLEGGVKNIARRDGLGTAFGAAVAELGDLPDVYVQAVGSAAGAIATHELGRREREARRTQRMTRLALSQNAPFTPIARSYARRSHVLLADDEATARGQLARIDAQVLSNMAPPYAIRGGIREVLVESGGDVVAVGNTAARSAFDEFLAQEGVELDPAAAVALASLEQFSQAMLPPEAHIVLHLTGGRSRSEPARFPIATSSTLRISQSEARSKTGIEQIRKALLRATSGG